MSAVLATGQPRKSLYHAFFIRSSTDGHLSCGHILASGNKPVMNLRMLTSRWRRNMKGCPCECMGKALLFPGAPLCALWSAHSVLYWGPAGLFLPSLLQCCSEKPCAHDSPRECRTACFLPKCVCQKVNENGVILFSILTSPFFFLSFISKLVSKC